MSFDESRLNELKSALNAKMAEQQQIADSMKFEGSTLIADAEKKAAFQKNMGDIREIKGLIEDLSSFRDVSDWASSVDQKSVAAEAAVQFPQGASRFSSVGEAFLNSAEFKALQGGRAGVTMNAAFTTKSLHAKAFDADGVDPIYSGLPSGTPGSFGVVERDPMVVAATRRNRVRDLFPVRTTNSAVIEYFRQIGFTTPSSDDITPPTNNAAPIGEYNGMAGTFQNKPRSSMQFIGSQVPVRTIAHWEAAHRNVLADEPQLRAIIDNELLYGLRLAEDNQLLLGDGTGDQLQGIMTTGGVQNYQWSSGELLPVPDTKADAIRRALTLSYLAYYEPTGIIVNPQDWEDIELTKNSQGTYLMAMSIASGSESRVWRVPVIDTPAVPVGYALVGAFGTGAQIYDREAASIRISEQHEDFFTRNAVVILAEERLALAVKRPESFVIVEFDNAPVAP